MDLCSRIVTYVTPGTQGNQSMVGGDFDDLMLENLVHKARMAG